MAEILIIEPELQKGYRMSEALTIQEHICRMVTSIADGLEILLNSSRLLTILNARLPWTESISLLRMLEDRGCPVLFITSDKGNTDHLHALYGGNCGVLHDPYDGAALRQAVSQLMSGSRRQITIGELSLDTDRHQVTLAGKKLSLTAQEFALLHALMRSPDAALTREELLRTAWGYQNAGETRTVDVHVQRLRRKLGSGCIETVYKHGYRLKMA